MFDYLTILINMIDNENGGNLSLYLTLACVVQYDIITPFDQMNNLSYRSIKLHWESNFIAHGYFIFLFLVDRGLIFVQKIKGAFIHTHKIDVLKAEFCFFSFFYHIKFSFERCIYDTNPVFTVEDSSSTMIQFCRYRWKISS